MTQWWETLTLERGGSEYQTRRTRNFYGKQMVLQLKMKGGERSGYTN